MGRSKALLAQLLSEVDRLDDIGGADSIAEYIEVLTEFQKIIAVRLQNARDLEKHELIQGLRACQILLGSTHEGLNSPEYELVNRILKRWDK